MTGHKRKDSGKMLARKIFYRLPPGLRFAVRRVAYFPTDCWRGITGRRHRFEPPKGLTYTGGGDFIASGQIQLRSLITHAQLQPHHSVLDVGSGIGRTAAALTTYLGPDGSYDGFDVVELGVKWCRRKISSEFPNFRFQYVPLHNDLYNTHRQHAEQFAFNYPDQSFDVVFLFSVFTHMQVHEIRHYLSEIRRVLKPGGRCLATFFVYDAEIEKHISDRAFAFAFPVDFGSYRLMDQSVKSANIAVKMEVLDQLCRDVGLIKERVVRGHWNRIIKADGRNDFQDIVVLRNVH